MSDDRLDERLSNAARGYNEPPAPRREVMWERIEAARREAGAGSADRREPGGGSGRFRWNGPPRWAAWAVGMAALLAVGIGLGRLTMARQAASPATTGRSVAAAGPATAAPRTGRSDEVYRLAAAQTFSQAEALLVALKTDPIQDTASVRRLSSWAKDVLSSTRLLMDSPAGKDPRVSKLLGDLELVLVQVVQLEPGQDDAAARRLIEDAVRDHDMMPRIRSAVPAGQSAIGD